MLGGGGTAAVYLHVASERKRCHRYFFLFFPQKGDYLKLARVHAGVLFQPLLTKKRHCDCVLSSCISQTAKWLQPVFISNFLFEYKSDHASC